MKSYTVSFSEKAFEDLISSVEWGVEAWGEEMALAWYDDVMNTIAERLGTFPNATSLAPDSEEYDVEVRQTVIGRYRVLFHVGEKVVTVLHIRGPYTGTLSQ